MNNKVKWPARAGWIGGLAVVVAAAALFYGMSQHGGPSAAAPEHAAPLVREGKRVIIPPDSALRKSLAIQSAVVEAVQVPLVLPAVVEADPAHLVKVLPPLAGRIVSLNKQLGDTVKAGDVLFTIDSADLAQASSDAAKAQAALALASRNLDRQRALDKDDIAARRDLEQAQSDYTQAASEAERASSRLAQLGARGNSSGKGTAGGSNHLLAVRSPISGHVVDLTAATGGYWNDTNAPVMTVADLSHVFITASAQERDLGDVYVGQSGTVRLDAFPDTLPGQVRYVGQLLDADTRTTKVRMVFDNPDGRLRPGMFAQTTLLSRPHQGILLPATALVQSGFYDRVFVEVAPWQFEARVVRAGMHVGDRVEVLSGLRAGERVVVRDGVVLND